MASSIIRIGIDKLDIDGLFLQDHTYYYHIQRPKTSMNKIAPCNFHNDKGPPFSTKSSVPCHEKEEEEEMLGALVTGLRASSVSDCSAERQTEKHDNLPKR